MAFFTLFLSWAAGGSSEPKQEEVKRLPGGKIKKKVQSDSSMHTDITHIK